MSNNDLQDFSQLSLGVSLTFLKQIFPNFPLTRKSFTFFVAPSLQIFWSSSIFQTNLTLIKDRLETNYYRSKANLQWEIELLHSNCIKFNGETDEESNGLFSLSKALTAGLYEIIAMD